MTDDLELHNLSQNMSNFETSPLLEADTHSDTISTLSERENLLPKDAHGVEVTTLPEASTLGRKISWSSAYILVISRVIGSGIFAMPGVIVQNVGSPGLALVLWVVGAFAAWAGLAISMEFGTMLPRSGGVKVYLEYVYRKPRFLTSTLVAVNAVCLGFTATNCIIFAKYTLFALDLHPTDLAVKLFAVGLLSAITIVHSCFYRTGIVIQNFLGWIKLGLTGFMILVGIAVLFRQPKDVPILNDPWKDSKWEFNALSTAFFKVLYSFSGLENVNNVMNEVKNPIRTIKSVGPAGLLTACILYVLINLAYLAVVPLEQVKQSRELIAALFFERLGFGRVVLPVTIALCAVGNVMVVTFSASRLNQEVARAGFLPFAKFLASNEPFQAPMGGLIVHFIPSVIVIVFPPSSSVYAFIADVEGYAGQFFALAVAVGLLLLRRREPELRRPFKAWILGVWLRIAICVFLIVAPIFPPRNGSADVTFFYAAYALVGLSVLGAGVIYWAVFTVALPHYGGYRLEEETEVLKDGMTITTLVHRPLK